MFNQPGKPRHNNKDYGKVYFSQERKRKEI